jgi:hypothetical protein
MVYDKAKYHYEGEFPADIPSTQAFVHSGLFLGWIIDSGLASDEFLSDFGEEVSQFRERKLTGPQLYAVCDGVLSDDILNEEGNRFAQAYFDFETGPYLREYKALLGSKLPSLYYVQDTWDNYEKLKQHLDERFHDWKRKSGM